MGLLTDILKEIPQAAVLQEKIADIERKYAASDTENAILKDDLRQARSEIAKLKKQVEDSREGRPRRRRAGIDYTRRT